MPDPLDYNPDAIDAERKSRMTLPMRRFDELKSVGELLSIVNAPSSSGGEGIPDAGWKQEATDELEQLRGKSHKPQRW